ncbi:MAG: hypothetical protein NTV05_01210 [Acidobacteria bacterium]|nr:hypothetical protein [Acidobacteriota bacterium]
MRVILSVGVVLCLVAGVVAERVDPVVDAASVLAAARAALGGEQKLAAVTSFTATGRTRQLRGNNLVPIVFEMWCELPDKYVRKDEIPAQESDPTSSGFNGDSLIQIPPPPPAPPMAARPGAPGPATPAKPAAGPATGAPAPAAPPPGATAPPQTSATAPGGTRPASGDPLAAAAAAATAMSGRPGGTPPTAGGPPSGPPPDPRKARVTTVKQDFVRLTLGMFAASFSSYPVTFRHIGQAEAPQGKADVLEVKGAGTFLLKLFINSGTHLPVMVSWTVPATNVVIKTPDQPAPATLPPGSIVVEAPAAPPATAPKEELAKYAQDIMALRKQALTSRLIEHRVYYADYRDIGNGLKFPFRLRRAVAGDTIEEMTFDEFAINKKIDPPSMSSPSTRRSTLGDLLPSSSRSAESFDS